VEKAKINDEILTKTYDSKEKQGVIIASAEGWSICTYKYVTYKSETEQTKVDIEFNNDDSVKDEKQTGEIRAAEMAFARYLKNDTANEINPEVFPEVLKEELKDTSVKINVLEKNDIEKAEMNGLLAVNRGSKYDPRFVELHY